jgi:hypothetical protein
MDKSDPNENLEELKKKKFLEMEKKRAQRMEDFKKN